MNKQAYPSLFDFKGMTHLWYHVINYAFAGSVAVLLIAWYFMGYLIQVNGQPAYVVVVGIWVVYVAGVTPFMHRHDREGS